MQNKKELEIISRIIHLPGELNIDKYKFMKSIGEKSDFFARLQLDELKITDEIINNICEAFPQINREWILTENGKSLTNRNCD